MINMYEKFHTKGHGAKFFKENDNGDKVFLHGKVIFLGFMFELDGNALKVIVGSICVYMEWKIMVGVCHKDIHSQYGFNDFECWVHFRGPTIIPSSIIVSNF